MAKPPSNAKMKQLARYTTSNAISRRASPQPKTACLNHLEYMFVLFVCACECAVKSWCDPTWNFNAVRCVPRLFILLKDPGVLSEPLKLCHRLAAIHLTFFPTQQCLPRCRPQFQDSAWCCMDRCMEQCTVEQTTPNFGSQETRSLKDNGPKPPWLTTGSGGLWSAMQVQVAG